jgi:glycosyltransferase involved in cell wall biosynthesis
MKILLVTSGFLPDGLGGVELSLARFARWAMDEGHEVLVFRRLALEDEDEFVLREEEVEGIPVVGLNYRFRDATTFLHLLNNTAIRERYASVLREFDPDVVHVHHLTCLTTEIVDATEQAGVPLVLSLHDYWMGCPRGQRIMADLSYCPNIEVDRCIRCYRETWPHWFPEQRDPTFEHRVFGEYHARVREVLEKAGVLLVPSPFAKGVFVRDGVPEQALEIVEYGMDVDAYRSVPRRESSMFRIGFLGSVLPSKGVHLLVEAFKRIGGSDRTLDIHGPVLPFHQDHGYGERLRVLSTGWEAQISFHGAYAPEATPRILAGLDAVVVPSIWYETYCMVIREAFLAGVPVMASNFGAMAEAIEDRVTGLLFQVGDSVDLAARLEELARRPELRRDLAASEKRVVTVAENGRQTVSIYERLIHGSAG